MNLAKTFAPFDHTNHLTLFQASAYMKTSLTPSFQSTSPTLKQSQRSKELAAISSTKGPRWGIRSPHCVFKLIVYREAASRHQQTTSRSQSARLRAIQQFRKQFIFKSDLIPGVQPPPFPQINNIPKDRRVFAFTAPYTLLYR